MFSSKNKKTVLFYIIAVFFICLDRFLKLFAFQTKPDIKILGDIFKITFSPNKYIAFSIPLGGIVLHSILGVLTTAIIIWFIHALRKKDYLSSLFIFSLLLGASSNLLDRFQYGFVIDYLDLKYFTVFNIADSMIFISVISLFFILDRKEKHNKTNLQGSKIN